MPQGGRWVISGASLSDIGEDVRPKSPDHDAGMRLSRGTAAREIASPGGDTSVLSIRLRRLPRGASLLIGGAAGLCVGALLGSQLGHGAPEWQFERRSSEDWARALGASSPETRTRAAFALSESPVLPNTGCLRLVQHLDDTSEVRDEIHFALIRWARTGQCVEETAAVLSTQAPAAVRRLAADVLRGAGAQARRASPALIAALTDPVPDVRNVAAAALGAGGDTSARVQNALTEATSDPDTNVRATAIEALAGLPGSSDRVIRVACRAARDQDPSIRAAGVSALEHVDVRQPELQAMLIRALRDSAANVRAAAARSLGWVQTGDVALRAALARATMDPDPLVRNAAALSLSRVRNR